MSDLFEFFETVPLHRHIEILSVERAKAAKLETALRLCVDAMQDVHIYGDGRLDDQTRREFRVAFDAAEAVGIK